MRSPLIAVVLTAFASLSPAVVFAGDQARHPLIGEPPAPMHVRTAGSTTESAWATREHEELVATLVGLRVYDTDENELGDVSAVLFANDGGVDTLLIRMGESSEVAGQDVALPFDLVTTATGGDGRTMIVVATDGEGIAGATRFLGVDEVPLIPGN